MTIKTVIVGLGKIGAENKSSKKVIRNHLNAIIFAQIKQIFVNIAKFRCLKIYYVQSSVVVLARVF